MRRSTGIKFIVLSFLQHLQCAALFLLVNGTTRLGRRYLVMNDKEHPLARHDFSCMLIRIYDTKQVISLQDTLARILVVPLMPGIIIAIVYNTLYLNPFQGLRIILLLQIVLHPVYLCINVGHAPTHPKRPGSRILIILPGHVVHHLCNRNVVHTFQRIGDVDLFADIRIGNHREA